MRLSRSECGVFIRVGCLDRNHHAVGSGIEEIGNQVPVSGLSKDRDRYRVRGPTRLNSESVELLPSRP